MYENICITGVTVHKKSDELYLASVRIATGIVYSQVSTNCELYERFINARNRKDEESIYSLLFQIATEVLKRNDIYFNTLEFI